MASLLTFITISILIGGSVTIFRSHRDRAALLGIDLKYSHVFYRYIQPPPPRDETEKVIRSTVQKAIFRFFGFWLMLNFAIGLFIVPFIGKSPVATQKAAPVK